MEDFDFWSERERPAPQRGKRLESPSRVGSERPPSPGSFALERGRADPLPLEDLPTSFQDEGARYFTWASVPDPLDEGARAKALAPSTLRSAAGSDTLGGDRRGRGRNMPELPSSLATLVAPETFKAVLRHRWKQDGDKLSAYTHGVAGALIAIAAEWVKASNDEIATLKALRRKLGTLPSGLHRQEQGAAA